MRLYSSAYILAATVAVAQMGCVGASSGSRDSVGLGPEARQQISDYQSAQTPAPRQAHDVHNPSARTVPSPRIPSPQKLQALTLPSDPQATPAAAAPAPAVFHAAPAPTTPQVATFTNPGPTPQASSAATEPVASPTRTRLHRFGEMDDLRPAKASPLDDQGNLRRVTFTTEGADFDVEVDPTGQWLAYASTRHRQTADLYLQRVNGTAVTQLTTDPADDVMPSISPSGKQVAFASDRSGTFDIYLMDIAGGPAIKLTDDGAQNIHPSFSPDGQQIVYCSRGSQSGVWELILIDVASPAQRRIVGHGLFPVWSPTDNKIAYQRARERGSRWFSVWTVEINEQGDAMRPTEVAASANAAVITPEWSPDGRNIVFCTVLDPTADSPAGSKADIWICNADGSGRARLTHGNYGNLYPTWATDGAIYFVSNRGVDAVENVYAVRPDQAVFLARQRERSSDTMEATAPDPTPLTE